MIKKEKQRDIMDELLSTTPQSVPAEIQELTDFLNDQREQDGDSSKNLGGKTTKKKRRKKTGAKRKTTHYLSEEIFDGLDEAKEKIRKIAPTDQKTSISKSQIVDRALKMILHDFEAKGEKSSLVRLVLESPQNKTDE